MANCSEGSAAFKLPLNEVIYLGRSETNKYLFFLMVLASSMCDRLSCKSQTNVGWSLWLWPKMWSERNM